MNISKNARFILVLFFILAGSLLLLNVLNASTEPETPTPQTVTTISTPVIHLEETGNSRNKYGWIIVTGTIINDGTASHSVSGYTDFYDKNGVKFDHILFFVNVDPHGKTSFECTSIDAEKYNGVKYRVYIDDIF